MQLIPDTIDFSAYLSEPDESAYVRPASAYIDALIDRFHNPETSRGARLPWGRHEFRIAFRPGETTLWAGMNGHGKSLLLGQLMIGFMAQGERALIQSFEMKPVVTLSRMCRQASQGETPAIAYIKGFGAWTDGKLWMYDQQGTTTPERVLSVSRYFAAELAGTHVVIDSLMKCGIAEDDYNGQKAFVDELTALARDRQVHVHLVHHTRKQHDEFSPPGKMDAKGTGAITDLVDNCVTVWRNKRKEAAAAKSEAQSSDPDALMIIDKQRNGEWEGKIGLWFDPASHQFVSTPGGAAASLTRGGDGRE
jgi:twinkle protein